MTAGCGDIVKLNVGGRLFVTTRTTLTTFPHSMLAGMFRGDLPAGALFEGGIFIDRDPSWFPLILTFLRDGRVALPESALERAALRQEAEFYALAELVAAIDDAEAAAADAAAAAAADQARQAEGARARDYIAIHRAELLKTIGKVVEREQAAIQAARDSQEASAAARRHVLEQIAGLQGALADPADVDQLRMQRMRLEAEAGRLKTAMDEAAQVLRLGEQRLRHAQLAQLIALGADMQAAEVQLAALRPGR